MASLIPRPYQQECIDKILQENTIIVSGTGTGKTLIAIKCMDRLRLKAREEKEPGHDRVMFVVPTVGLVDQHSTECEKHCTVDPSRIVRLSSSDKMSWSKSRWEECLQDFDIFIGTAEIFSRALVKHAYIDLKRFCCVFFDECHKAVKNHPMVSICKDAIYPHLEQDSSSWIRIAGFTASPSQEGLNKTDEDVELAIFTLQQTLQAKIFAPEVPDEYKGASSKEDAFVHVEVPPEIAEHGECARFAETWIQDLLGKLPEAHIIKDVPNTLKRLRKVFDQLGKDGFKYAIENSVIPQLKEVVVRLLTYAQDDIGDSTELQKKKQRKRQEASELEENLPSLKKRISEEAEALDSCASIRCPSWSALSSHTSKVQVLIDILRREFTLDLANQESSHLRCLVLVEETSIPCPLAHLLTTGLKDVKIGDRSISAGSATGVNAMSSVERREAIESFRIGVTSILVATPALEEGFDVPECKVVVRFDKFTTMRSHIQGSGRARHSSGRVYYFANDPLKAQRAAKRMLTAAQNDDMKPKDEDNEFERQEHLRKRARLEGKHPYGGGENGAEITIFTCRDIVYTYCAKVLRENHNADALYEWSSDPSSIQLSKVTYPSPDGFKAVSREEVASYWEGVDMNSVFEPLRCKNYATKDREELKFLFIVARRLREEGHLDGHNQATVRARKMTSEKCPMAQREVGISIGSKFPKEAKNHGVANPKQRLHEWCQRFWKGVPTDQLLKFDTNEAPGGFKSEVRILKLKHRFEGDVRPSKKLAEHAAAEKALAHPDVA